MFANLLIANIGNLQLKNTCNSKWKHLCAEPLLPTAVWKHQNTHIMHTNILTYIHTVSFSKAQNSILQQKSILQHVNDWSLTVQPLSQQSNCCTSRKCIRGHISMHEIFTIFISFFIPVLSRPSFTSRTPNNNQEIKQLFYVFLVQIP